jgi:hypothetical protein
VRPACFLVAAILVISTVTFADSTSELERDAALAGIDACLHGGKGRRDLDKNTETLTLLYRLGDKAVPLTLLRFTYLTDFFDLALLADPDGFLSTVASLPEGHQQAVASSVSGWTFGLALPRFEAVRATLRGLPDSSPNRELAKKFLETVNTYNDSFLGGNLPDSTFGGSWYSRELPSLGEEPLWPLAPGHRFCLPNHCVAMLLYWPGVSFSLHLARWHRPHQISRERFTQAQSNDRQIVHAGRPTDS